MCWFLMIFMFFILLLAFLRNLLWIDMIEALSFTMINVRHIFLLLNCFYFVACFMLVIVSVLILYGDF